MPAWKRVEATRPQPKTPPYGISARDVFVRPEEQEDFDGLLAGFYRDLQPQGALEQTLFNELVQAAWNLRRFHQLEAGLIADLNEHNERRLERVSSFIRRCENTLLRCTRELRVLQSNRAAKAAAGTEAAVPDSPLADPLPVERVRKTRWQAETERVRAAIGEIDLESAVLSGAAPGTASYGGRAPRPAADSPVRPGAFTFLLP